MRIMLLVDFSNLFKSCWSDADTEPAAGERALRALVSLKQYLAEHSTARLRQPVLGHTEIAVLDDQRWRRRWQPLMDGMLSAGFKVTPVERVKLVATERRYGSEDDNYLIGVAKTVGPRYDAVVLVANDGDYADTLRFLRAKGLPAVVAAYENATQRLARTMREAASEVLSLRGIMEATFSI
jgi:hypothetical protein